MHCIDTAWSVNELLRRIPDAAATLNRLGIDTCCGGALPVGEAAASAGTTVDAIMSELRDAAPAPAPGACSIRR